MKLSKKVMTKIIMIVTVNIVLFYEQNSSVCKYETEHNEFKPHFLSRVSVCTNCGVLTSNEYNEASQEDAHDSIASV